MFFFKRVPAGEPSKISMAFAWNYESALLPQIVPDASAKVCRCLFHFLSFFFFHVPTVGHMLLMELKVKVSWIEPCHEEVCPIELVMLFPSKTQKCDMTWRVRCTC